MDSSSTTWLLRLCPSSASNLQTPATLFHMATAAAPGRTGPDSLRFGIAGGNSRGIFVMQRSDRQTGELILVQQLRMRRRDQQHRCGHLSTATHLSRPKKQPRSFWFRPTTSESKVWKEED
ncbi:fibulin-7 [Lates japonicus]|uniref:Fibulin-7 n=1 Tax=Lates japonicus TaxID=270547 RepID=A0AAD3N794_LATJO|nr:fibulin-7 [Lates japonicus]